MTNPLLQLENLSAGYGPQTVLRDIGFAVNEGEVAAIIGPNGHGKTTMLRAISGLAGYCVGQIRLDGTELNGRRADQIVAAGVVHVPQGDLVFPEMTVLDNLLMGAYLPAADKLSDQHLRYVFDLLPRLEERRHQRASTLSGGERRMLGIGRGLMTGGRILMLDEPSLGLAPIVIEQIYAVIEELKSQGRTIVLVEENPERAMEVADSISLLDNGQFVWDGTASDLADNDNILNTYLGG